jgi:ferrochelatase
MATGVLLMGFGGPDSLEAVAPFMANLMGREPSPEAVQRATRRYLTIGGASPLPHIAREIAGKLSEKLNIPVAVGMRYWNPFMTEGLAELAAAGVDRVVAVSLSPFESRHSAGGYRASLAEAAKQFPDMTVVEAPSFRRSPDFLMALADGVDAALADLPKEARRRAVLFTAHSLPLADLGDDPYVDELRETAAEVAARTGLPRAADSGKQGWLKHVDAYGTGQAPVPWMVAYQSKGQRGSEWLEPDIADVIAAMPR